MKKIFLIGSILLALSACDSPANHSNKAEIENLQLKLEATEAQLLNVSAELSKCKNQVKPMTLDSLAQ